MLFGISSPYIYKYIFNSIAKMLFRIRIFFLHYSSGDTQPIAGRQLKNTKCGYFISIGRRPTSTETSPWDQSDSLRRRTTCFASARMLLFFFAVEFVHMRLTRQQNHIVFTKQVTPFDGSAMCGDV